ncbi:MAG: YigZ family protein [Marinilabiliales bacterium]|nr:MAG: YigZ family protein [Marinilabiliales bacterium]
MEQLSYRTIKTRSEGYFKDRGSKFLAFAFPVTSEEQVKSHLGDLRGQYHDARHHCYAWRLGADAEHYRANDDGEPSGTAGRPILMQIHKHELTNVLIVVVRYFGGVLLGTGGLVNAYRSAAADAIENAAVVVKTVEEQFRIDFPYEAMNDVMRVLKELEATHISQEFDTDCTITLSIPAGRSGELAGRLAPVANVTVTILPDD